MKRKNLMLIVLCVCALLACAAIPALQECKDEVTAGESCTVISPYISYCATYTVNVSYTNGTMFATDASITEIGGLGVYNYSVTFQDIGTYILKLCDDSVRTIIVVNETNSTSIRNDLVGIAGITDLSSNLSTIRTEISYVSDNVTEVQNRIGDPTTNSTTLWDWIYIPTSLSCSDADFPGISRLWCFVWRTVHGISP